MRETLLGNCYSFDADRDDLAYEATGYGEGHYADADAVGDCAGDY